MFRFPFGRPALRRPPRVAAGAAELFVLGVCPSALHVRWQRPDGVVAGALAVADEPTVFWDGSDAAQRIDQWRDQVGWSADWGSAGPAAGNGSSGRHVAEHVLRPLGVSVTRAYLTDCLPTYFVKRGPSSQTAVIRKLYDPFAIEQGLPTADLPERPPPEDLVGKAVGEEGPSLIGQLVDSAAPLVVTLGQEAADVLAALVSADRVLLSPDAGYGRTLPVTVAGRRKEWLPLVHPGDRGGRWRRAHREWTDGLV
ncbi:hypothetical protein LWP59_22060 [Amycolatopsis acidiphila]|uniref:Uracil-DNA glycosylase-like domain-containing protein n=1 Tax=Amycolatopsis acidiphila TaxID=715473 RepID=A0A557ZUQ4_9PSEU|nr:hypothetical protein [Amycolatopsis acidiphila]TVT15756.1 hypothetical protein FNH06_35690 [Amycolatopsis acidiphila]UIJ56854.1 hypothetical protein LWP59_22060 [Amycolatopsis acidiphila]GHG54754.1 hypothetical protein GCM10017788_04700 [Amycolatopsis acidiphila]